MEILNMKRRVSLCSSHLTTKKAKRSNTTEGRLLSLPDEILVTIAELLVSPDGINFVCFSAVCRSCRSAAANVKFTLVRQMPWIMLPTTTHSREAETFNPSENKFYKLPLPKTPWTTTCGSVKGWVATVSDDQHIHLLNLNPFTRHPQRISLPPLYNTENFPRFPGEQFVKKICLPSSPTDDPNGLAVVIYGTDCQLAFARIGSQAWVPIRCSVRSYFYDAVICKGRFYAVNFHGDVMKLDFRRRLAVKIASQSMESGALYYLVESDGDLLQVAQCPENGCKRVFKLDFRSRQWIAIRSLGDRSLFLGAYSYSMSIQAPELFKCRSNCVYFINDEYLSEKGIIVYSLDEDKIIETENMGQSYLRDFVSPLWVSPFVYWQKS